MSGDVSRSKLIRQLGPTVWVVLEALHERGVATDHGLIAPMSIRALAAELGLAKNTVDRALRRLTAAGLVDAIQARAASGEFAAGHYRLLGTSTATATSSRAITDNTTSDSVDLPAPNDDDKPQPSPSIRTVSIPLEQLTFDI